MKNLLAVVVLISFISLGCVGNPKAELPKITSTKDTATENASINTYKGAEKYGDTLRNLNDSIISVEKADSVFWVDNIEQFAEDNNLIFFKVRGYGYEEGLNYYILGTYERYSFAEMLENIHVVVKNEKGYKVILFPEFSTPQLSGIAVIGAFKLGTTNILELEGYYHTAWSMMSPIAGAYFECNKSVLYIDIDNGELLFSQVFKAHYEDTHEFDKYDLDSLYQRLYPEGTFENDTLPTISTYQWFNYQYVLNNNTINFYKVDDNPTGECNSYTTAQQKDIIAKYVTGKKPDFYYEYEKRNKRWLKHSNK
jgi:hypothetical protein